METQKTNRMIYWDLLRILACFSVIMLHSASQDWYDLPVTSVRWLVCNSYDALFRFGVPVFVMISGSLFLSRKGELSVKRLYLHNIARLGIAYVFWSCLYGLWDARMFEEAGLRDYLLEMLAGRFHLWFLPMMIGIYMLLPVLKLLAEEQNKKVLEYFLVLFLVMQIGRETVLAFQFSNQLKNMIRLVPLEMVCSYIGYFMLGYYLYRYPFSQKVQHRIYLAGILGAIGAVAAGNLISLWRGEATAAFYDSFSLPTFCISAALFIFFQEKVSSVSWSKRSMTWIRRLSDNTFGVYLIHLWVLEIMEIKGINTMMISSVVSVPLVALLCFLIGNVMISCIRMIPIVGKYIS